MLEELLTRASLTVSSAADLLRNLAASPWVRAVPVTATIPAGDTSVRVRHGLGRAMNGAVVVACTDETRRVSVDIPGTDSDKYMTVRISSAHASDFVIKLRAF